MAEFISREDVIEKLTGVFQLQAETAKAIVAAIPAADVVERKKGAWVETYGKYGNFRHQCSECGEMFGMPFDFDGKYYPYKFCPNCGANMEES